MFILTACEVHQRILMARKHALHHEANVSDQTLSIIIDCQVIPLLTTGVLRCLVANICRVIAPSPSVISIRIPAGIPSTGKGLSFGMENG